MALPLLNAMDNLDDPARHLEERESRFRIIGIAKRESINIETE